MGMQTQLDNINYSLIRNNSRLMHLA